MNGEEAQLPEGPSAVLPAGWQFADLHLEPGECCRVTTARKFRPREPLAIWLGQKQCWEIPPCRAVVLLRLCALTIILTIGSLSSTGHNFAFSKICAVVCLALCWGCPRTGTRRCRLGRTGQARRVLACLSLFDPNTKGLGASQQPH